MKTSVQTSVKTSVKECEWEPSKWILSRLEGKDYDFVRFVNGYGNNRPYFVAMFECWLQSESECHFDYSNGLRVDVKKGTVLIFLGDIVETGTDNL
jgi:hypothetical protein